MNTRKLIICSVALALVATAASQQANRYVLLPQSAGNLSFRLFDDGSRLGAWQPSRSEIDELEANLSQISKLNITGGESTRHIEYPEAYFRQYIGLTDSKQRKRIYVNAFCDDPPPSTWKTQLYVVMDGWTCYWQAFYDPATKKFSNLLINGRA